MSHRLCAESLESESTCSKSKLTKDNLVEMLDELMNLKKKYFICRWTKI